MKRIKNANTLISLIGIAIGIVFLVVSQNYTKASVDGGYTSAATWPVILSWAMIGLSALLLISTIAGKSVSTGEIVIASPEFRAVLLMMLALIVYYFSFQYLGCLITNAIFLPILLICFGERRWKFIVLYDIGALAVIYVLFQVVLESKLAQPFFM